MRIVYYFKMFSIIWTYVYDYLEMKTSITFSGSSFIKILRQKQWSCIPTQPHQIFFVSNKLFSHTLVFKILIKTNL